MKYDVVLCECMGNRGLNKAISAKMADKLNDGEFYPVIFDADYAEVSAMGFISRTAAEKLKFDYYELKSYIGSILDEEHEKIHEIDGVKIIIGDNGEDGE